MSEDLENLLPLRSKNEVKWKGKELNVEHCHFSLATDVTKWKLDMQSCPEDVRRQFSGLYLFESSRSNTDQTREREGYTQQSGLSLLLCY